MHVLITGHAASEGGFEDAAGVGRVQGAEACEPVARRGVVERCRVLSIG